MSPQRVTRTTLPIGRTAWVLVALAGCAAAPPLQFYTLAAPPASTEVPMSADGRGPSDRAPVIDVARVTLPDYLDSQDLVVRQGNVLERSSTGRWASRLSLAATELLTERLAMRRPDAWVVDRSPARSPDYRLQVHLIQLDIASDGTGIVEAEWEIVPHDALTQVIRGRTRRLTMNGSVATDQGIARFERALLDRLADQIDISTLH